MTKKRPLSWICLDENGAINNNCPHENTKKFNEWVRNNLPESNTGYAASDLDFILWNWKTNKIMLLEIKTHNRTIKTYQKIMFNLLNKWIKKGVDDDWTYLGFHLIVFENTSFEDGKCFLNNKEISEIELINFLSL